MTKKRIQLFNEKFNCHLNNEFIQDQNRKKRPTKTFVNRKLFQILFLLLWNKAMNICKNMYLSY